MPHTCLLAMCFVMYAFVISTGLCNSTAEEPYRNNPCEIKLDLNQILVNCSNRSLKSIDSSWFPENTTDLMLQSNQLTVIPNNTLSHLYQLERLSIQDNILTSIESKAFQGLNNLQYLNLENNYIDLFSLPIYIFSDLIRLTELRLIWYSDDSIERRNITYSVTNGSFANGMFAKLVHLRIFTVHASSEVLYFNPEFSQLLNLSVLVVSGIMSTIQENSFQHVKYVQDLTLTNCRGLHTFSDVALPSFQTLNYLEYNLLSLGLHRSLDMFRPLVNTSLNRLTIKYVRKAKESYSGLTTGDGIIDSNNTKYLKQICINELVLMQNYMFIVYRGALKSPTIDRCLNKLFIVDKLILGVDWALFELFRLKNATAVTVRNSLPTTIKGNIESLKSQLTTDSNAIINMEEISFKNKRASLLKLYSSPVTKITISESIQYLDLSSLYDAMRVDVPFEVIGGQNLLSVSVVNNGFSRLLIPIQGIPNIQCFYFSYNDLSILSLDFFNAYPTLRILKLDHCKFSSSFMAQNSFRLFKNLSNLQELDISYNSLDVLSDNTFSKNPNLQSLKIASNRFRKIPFDLKLTPNLKYLDLRENVITSISKSDRDTMERHIESLGSFQLFLSGNILSCGCDNLPFLQWLRLTNVQLDENKNFTCINSHGVLSSTLAYGHLDGLWRDCWGQFFFNVAIVLLCFIFIGFLVSILWMKNKTLIISGILQAFTDFKLKKCSDYRYGVFIGYSDKDYHFACNPLREYIEESLKLTTFVLDRDLILSHAMADGIVEAINSSWRIVIVVNKMFIQQNQWFLFTIHSAMYSITPENPLRVIFLVEESCINQLPTEVLSSIPEDNVIIVTEWALTYELKQALKTRIC